MYLVRVALPDVPGQLGAVATVMGANGADITSVQVVGKDGADAVIDDFLVELAPGRLPDQLVSACQQLEGVRVDWIAFYPEGGSLASDLEALDLMTRDMSQAAESLTGSAVSVFHVNWAVLIDTTGPDGPVVTYATSRAPDLATSQVVALGDLDAVREITPEADWLPGWQDVVLAVAPVAGDRAIILGRQGGPAFLAPELARFGHLAALVR